MVKPKTETAIFAAGCFWGVQFYFDQVPGAVETEVGYIGGHVKKPTYEQVCYSDTGHAEATKVVFDPKKISYEKLVRHFFRMHDPTQMNRQGPDVGEQYRSAIFFTSDEQAETARKILDEMNQKEFDGNIVTAIEPAADFWPADDYHQKYTERTGRGMCHVDYAPI